MARSYNKKTYVRATKGVWVAGYLFPHLNSATGKGTVFKFCTDFVFIIFKDPVMKFMSHRSSLVPEAGIAGRIK